MQIDNSAEFYQSVDTGLSKLTMAVNKEQNVEIDKMKSFNKQELEAFLWIKENTSQNAILATNRHFLSPVPSDVYPPDWWDSRYYYLSAYAGRQIFLEGWAYGSRSAEYGLWISNIYERNILFFTDYDNQKPQLMQEVEVDYLVVSKFISPRLEICDKGLEKVFSNESIDIYGISKG